MKQILLVFLSTLFIPIMYGQTVASTNSGAVSNNNLIYSVGEIFVTPANQDEASSGGIAAISIIEFLTLGTNEFDYSEDLKFYPNPTSNFIFLESKNVINRIFIYDLSGKLVFDKIIIDNQIDLTNLQSGIYLLKTDNLNVETIKLIKK